MLKRPRAPSPSPTRPDSSSPPPLDSSASLPIAKRRRTAGPIIDSNQRRDVDSMDDGEDEWEDEEYEGGTSVDVPPDKVYEHVNHFLHGLHAEHQHRSRAALPFTNSHFVHSHLHHSHATPTFLSYREYPPASSPPMSSPPKYGRDSHVYPTSTSSNQYRGHSEFQESDAIVSYDSRHAGVDAFPHHKGAKADMQDDERLCVTHRYEDTNRLIGSLVLSRRRILVLPPTEPE